MHSTFVNKFRILKQVEDGKISVNKAAQLLDTDPRHVKTSLTRNKGRLDTLIEVADVYGSQTYLRAERVERLEAYAGMLGITMHQLNSLMRRADLEAPVNLRVLEQAEKKETTTSKWKSHVAAAISVIAGSDDIDNAAVQAEVSSRTVYRWVTKLMRLVGQEYTDLQRMSNATRTRLARQLETESKDIRAFRTKTAAIPGG